MLFHAFVDTTFKFRAVAGKFDWSDAGMTLYWPSGANNGGLQEGSPADTRNILSKLTN